MKFTTPLYLGALLMGVTTVCAHGYVDNATIGGEFYQVSILSIKYDV